MATIAAMIRALDAEDHDGFQDNEREFIEDMAALLEERNGLTNMLSDNQVLWIDRLWQKYINT